MLFRLFIVLFTLFCAAGETAPAEPIGAVKTLSGGVSLIRAGRTMPCEMDLHILVDDVIQTAADGRVGILFSDGARVALDPNSELKVNQFRFQPAVKDFGMLVTLVRGVAAYISGKIGQFAPETVKVETPVAVIGLRGTQFAVSLE